MAVSDDDVIKRKLLIEGEGGSDDVRISRLIKSFTKFCNSSESEMDCQDSCEKILMSLDHVDFAMTKTSDVFKMNEKEQALYSGLTESIGSYIASAREEITSSKSQLHQAKRIRKNRQEYDALAKVIQQHPDRQQTKEELEKVSEEIKDLRKMMKQTQDQLSLRKKQFHVLISAIHELQWILDESESDVERPHEDTDEPSTSA